MGKPSVLRATSTDLSKPTPWPPAGTTLEHQSPVPAPIKAFLRGRGYRVEAVTPASERKDRPQEGT